MSLRLQRITDRGREFFFFLENLSLLEGEKNNEIFLQCVSVNDRSWRLCMPSKQKVQKMAGKNGGVRRRVG